MPQHKWARWLLLFVLALTPLLVQAQTPEEAYEAAIELMNKYPDAVEKPNGELYGYLQVMSETQSAMIPEEILQLQWQVLNTSNNDREMRKAALAGMRYEPRDSVVDNIASYLTDPELRVMAAAVMCEWGRFNDGVPVLLDAEQYGPLAHYSAPDLDLLLLDAIQSASPYGRLKAAVQLSRLPGYSVATAVAYDLIDRYVTQQESYADTANLHRAVHSAFNYCDTTWTALGTHIAKGLVDTRSAFRLGAVFALERFAAAEEPAAIELLDDTAKNSTYRETQEYAAYFYSALVSPDTRYRTQP